MARYEYVISDKTFVNPYNFVTFNASMSKRVDINTTKKGKLHTGVLNCRLITRTPLAIPDGTGKPDERKHRTYEFFNYGDGRPVIPGSTLRGVIRSVYEAAADSCYSTADEAAAITVRSTEAFEPGLLMWDAKKNKWVLYEADRYKVGVRESIGDNGNGRSAKYKIVSRVELKKYGFGRKVRFSGYTSKIGKFAEEFSVDAGSKLPLKGYLYVGEPFSKKKFEGIFCLKHDRDAKVIKEYAADDKNILNLDQIKDIYNDEKINYSLKKNKGEFYAGYESAKRAGVIPLWYKKDERGVYMSLACIGRMAYNNTMGDLLGDRTPCTSRSAVCKACALFGMTSNEDSVGSRIRITDAYTDAPKNKWNMGYHTLKELARPKTSYLPFYAKVTDGKWSYDEQGTTIRGRKFYWHNEAQDAFETTTRTERNATMQLVAKDVEFGFKVYYNDITDTQLEELKWVLALGDNKADSSLCHKVGHGKPIGLGSAKIVIDSCVERTAAEGYELNENAAVEINKEIFSQEAVEELLIITDMNSTKGKNVCYPYIDNPNNLPFKDGANDIAAHKWFSKNYSLGSKSVKQKWVDINSVKINTATLCAYDIKPGGNNFGGGHNNNRYNGNRPNNNRPNNNNYRNGRR